MLIVDHLRPENVLYGIAAESKAHAMGLITRRLKESGDVTDAEECLRALMEREQLMTTAVGNGVALPHAFSQAAPDTGIAYMKVPGGVDFEALDQKPVTHIFCILGPPQAQGRHLKILARLARLLNHTDFREALDESNDPASLLAAFRAKETALLSPG